MPKILILSRQTGDNAVRTRNIQRILQNFGINADTMYVGDIPTLSGSGYGGRLNRILNWQSTGTYQAIIHCENRLSSDTNGTFYDAYNWSKTSENVTLPIGYFGAPNKQIWTDGRLPADLGIVPFNDADPLTYYQLPGATDFEASNPRGRTFGTRLVFPNGRKAWGRTTNYIFGSGNNKPGFFKFIGSALTNDVQPVLHLDWTEIGVTPPGDHLGDYIYCAGIRYYNKYFLPALSYSGRGSPDNFRVTQANGYAGANTFNIWLVLWFLEQAGILPQYRMPVTYDIDHPIPGVASAAHRTELTQAEIDRIELETMTWLYGRAQAWNMPVRCGVTTGVWRSNSYHSGRRTSSQYSEQLHKLLVNAHVSGIMPCCWHDHTYPNGRNDGSSYTRHTGGQYGVGNVVYSLKRLYNPSTGKYEWQNDTQIWSAAEVNKTGTNAHLTTRHAYRMHWEGSIKEMNDLGFPDGHCGREYYLNQAGNEYGNTGFLDFLLEETPVRALRVNDSTLSQYSLPQWQKGRDFRTLKYRGELELFLTAGMDGGMRGLWNPGSGADINDSDLNQWDNLGSTEGETNRDRRIRAKFLAYTTDLVLTQILFQGAVPYNHPDFCHSASATAPVSDYNETGNWNGLVECVRAVYEELCFGLLGNWFKPARSIWEIVEWRGRLK